MMCDISTQDVVSLLKRELGKEEFKFVSVKNVCRTLGRRVCSAKIVCYFSTDRGLQKLRLFVRNPCQSCGGTKYITEHQLNTGYLERIRGEMEYQFFPTCYLSKSTGVTAYEDITADGFHRLAIDESFDLNQCIKCVEMIARFHAASLLCEVRERKTLDKVYTSLDGTKKNHVEKYTAGKITEENMGILRQIVDSHLCQFSSSVVQRAFDFMESATKRCDATKTYQHCITHNDIRPKTLFVRQSTDNKVECRLTDFKYSAYNLPSYDLQTFLLNCTRKSFRDEYEDALIMHYYRTLHAVASSSGVNMEDRLTWEDFVSMYETTYPVVLASTPHLILDDVIPDGFACDDLNFAQSSFEEVKHELVKQTMEDCPLYKHRLLEVLVEIFSIVLM